MPEFFHADDRVRVYASRSSWIEGNAVRQLGQVLDRRGVTQAVGMADLHPGHHGPVGCVVAADGIVHPEIVGTDIGCGMTLFVLDAEKRQLRIDKAEADLRRLDDRDVAIDDLVETIRDDGTAEAHMGALGTVGGGNHFVELLHAVSVADHHDVPAGLANGALCLLVHSGSRSLGAAVFDRHRTSDGIDLGSDAGRAYMADHDLAVRFASANRLALARRALAALRVDGRLVSDVPHNFVEVVDGIAIHRKGCSPADRGIVALAGSRGTRSYLIAPPPAGVEGALRSLPHGAGRKRDRISMLERAKGKRPGDGGKRRGIASRLICEDKRLRIEEAPEAYKNVGEVVRDLEAFGLGTAIASMEPLVTFKTVREKRDD